MPFWRKLIVVLGILWLPATLLNAATDVGTAIVNQATMTYTDRVTGELVELKSNTSSILVAPLVQFELLSSNNLTASAGQSMSIAHSLRNTGNVDDQYSLSLENQLADNADLINLMLYIDSNNNGVVDAAEPVVSDSISVEPGESVSLVVTGVVPLELTGEEEIELTLYAQSADSELPVQTNTDRIIVEPKAKLSVELTSSHSCEVQSLSDEIVEYEMSTLNSSSTLPIPRNVVIDGQERSGVLLELAIPGQLQLVAGEELDVFAYQGIAVVKELNSNSGWMRYEHWAGGTSIEKIGLHIPSENFEKDERMGLSFSVEVQSVPVDKKVYLSGLIDPSGVGNETINSDTACVDIATIGMAAAQEIRFVEPTIALQKQQKPPDFSIDSDFVDAPIYRLHGDVMEASVSRAANDSLLDEAISTEYMVAVNGVYVELIATVPNEQLINDQAGVAHTLVNVESQQTGDTLFLLLRETGANTGVYRSIKPVLLSAELSSNGSYCPGNSTGAVPMLPDYTSDVDVCPLLSEIDDTIAVSFINESNQQRISDTAAVDPVSQVFDSTSLAGVSDAVVSIMVNGQLANHPVSEQPLVYITDEMGRFLIPRLPTSTQYSFRVEPPASYVFPSTVAPTQFISYSVSNASYGIDGFGGSGDGNFSIVSTQAPPVIDIPLDPANRDSLLLVEKSAGARSVGVGGGVTYSIAVKNRSDGELNDVSVIDYPAYGFKYIAGSASFEDQPIDDPQKLSVAAQTANVGNTSNSSTVNALRFSLSNLDANTEGILRYRMRASAGATDGGGVNRANANATTLSGLLLSTPTSQAKVNIEQSGVLSNQATLFGKVYVDSSCDYIQNNGEWPIAGVRLYLQDGTFVITDEDGQYSLYGLQPGLHALKVDTLTLPEGLALKPLDTRQAADPESRFVDLSYGDFHRADFAAFCPAQHADTVFAELQQRNKELRDNWLLSEASRFDPDGKAPGLDVRKRADTDGDLAQGMLGFTRHKNAENTQKRASITPGSENAHQGDNADPLSKNNPKNTAEHTPEPSDGEVLSVRTSEKTQMGDPKQLVKDITSDQAKAGTWLWPQNDLSWDGRFMAVITAGLTPELYVNDAPVPGTQIGEQIINRRAQAQLVAWYGVRLVPGLNKVEVRAKDAFGNERVLAEGAFRKPSAGVRLLLRTKQDTIEADGGNSTLPIDIVITDANNNPANGVYFVTLRSNGGGFVEKDLQLREPGMQVRVENGRGRVHLRSTELTGNIQVQAKTGSLDAHLNIVQVAAARPLIGAGLIELGGQWNSVSSGSDTRANLDEGFSEDARVALFLKGRVKNDMHLSLSYDSHKNKNVNVLRDLNPNEHYATYGDSSLRGVEAQSRSKLYAKLEKDKNSVMWGDYLTDNLAELDDLGRVQRTLTGVNGVLENEYSRIQVFAAEESSSRQSEEIAGNGTAMLYQLQQSPIVINSEVVELIVRDAQNPGLVNDARTLQRYVDYSIDFQTGMLRFSDPIPTLNEDLDPYFVRISYDMDNQAEEYLVSGIRMLHQITPNLQAGMSLTDDRNPIAGYTLSSVYANAQLSPHTKLSASVAVKEHRDNQTDGEAQRIHMEHLWKGRRDFRTSMTWGRASNTFDNSAAGISSGRDEWRIEHRQPLSNTLRATAEATRSRSLSDQSSNISASLIFEKTFSDWSVKAGGRYIQNKTPSQEFDFNTILLGVEKRFSFSNKRRGSIGIEYERNVENAQRYRFGLSARLQLHQHVSAYARYELENSLSLHSFSYTNERNTIFTAGLESDFLPSTKLYSEYRLRGNLSEQTMETATGIRGRYVVEPGLTISPAIEVIDALEGSNAQDSVAFSMGLIDERNPNRKFSTQAEIRETSSNRYYGFRGSIAQRLNVDWTGLVREEFTRQSPNTGELTSRHRFTLGLAKRPKRSNEHHALFMANWKQDFGPEDGMDRTTYLLSTHQNRQIAHNANLSGRFGARWSRTSFDSGSEHSNVIMGDFRASFDIRRRFELDLRGGWLGSGGSGDGKYSFGVGLSWLADRNLRLGMRYNVIGFREDDLDEQAFNTQGIRIGLQVKFDEDWFRWLE